MSDHERNGEQSAATEPNECGIMYELRNPLGMSASGIPWADRGGLNDHARDALRSLDNCVSGIRTISRLLLANTFAVEDKELHVGSEHAETLSVPDQVNLQWTLVELAKLADNRLHEFAERCLPDAQS